MRWTDKEIDWLINNWSKYTAKECEEFLPNRTASSIKAKASALKIKAKDECTKELLIKDLIEFYKVNNRVPSKIDFTKQNNLWSYSTYHRIFGSITNAIKEAQLPQNPKNNFSRIATKEELKNTIIRFYNENGRIPKRSECRASHQYLHSSGTYINRFGSWQSLLDELNLDNKRIVISDEEIINKVINFYKITGRAPKKEEFTCKDGIINYTTLLKRFGNINTILNIANVPYNNPFVSKAEKEILEFIKNNYNGIVEENRRILDGKEIDIYLPDLKLGIEFNGLYWHSEEKGKDKKYHLNKTLIAENRGIRLIQIFENEWAQKQAIVKSRVCNMIGLSNKIYARKCSIQELDAKTFKDFMNSNHIQGNLNSSIKLGLYHNGILVAAMGFAKARYTKVEYELTRYANILNTSIVGGASRLFKYFVKNYNPTSIVSYSDRRWNTGNLYTTIGFTFSHNSLPNYWYFKDKQLESRIKYQKHKLVNILNNFDPNLTEVENMKMNGYNRIFDCGNQVFIWKSGA